MASSGEKQTLYLVCDTSGSMGENGKSMLQRGIARAIEQYMRLGYGDCELKLVLWNTTASICEWNPDDEFPEQALECKGSASAEELCKLLPANDTMKVLLLTDGWWSKAESLIFKKWKRTLPSDTLRIIKIGSDANPLLRGDDVFSTDDFLISLDGWLSLADTSASDGDEDEW